MVKYALVKAEHYVTEYSVSIFCLGPQLLSSKRLSTTWR